MFSKFQKNKSSINFLKNIIFTSFLLFTFYPNSPNALNAGLEFQWDSSDNFKRLKWFQKDDKKSAKNKIFFFLRASDRKTGLIKVSLKVPDLFLKKIKKEKINFCQVQIGGYTKRSKCLKNISTEIEIDKKNQSIDIFPTSPIPSDKDNYAIVLNVVNPNRGGLYQFHAFGQSSGNIPVSFYLGSWTLKMQSQ